MKLADWKFSDAMPIKGYPVVRRNSFRDLRNWWGEIWLFGRVDGLAESQKKGSVPFSFLFFLDPVIHAPTQCRQRVTLWLGEMYSQT